MSIRQYLYPPNSPTEAVRRSVISGIKAFLISEGYTVTDYTSGAAEGIQFKKYDTRKLLLYWSDIATSATLTIFIMNAAGTGGQPNAGINSSAINSSGFCIYSTDNALWFGNAVSPNSQLTIWFLKAFNQHYAGMYTGGSGFNAGLQLFVSDSDDIITTGYPGMDFGASAYRQTIQGKPVLSRVAMSNGESPADVYAVHVARVVVNTLLIVNGKEMIATVAATSNLSFLLEA